MRQAPALSPAATCTASVIWDANDNSDGTNPYLGILAHASWVLVTGDSVNMVSEATGTGAPVYVIELPGGSAKFERFHDAMRQAGLTRPFDGTLDRWTYDAPDDAGRAAAEIRARLRR